MTACYTLIHRLYFRKFLYLVFFKTIINFYQHFTPNSLSVSAIAANSSTQRSIFTHISFTFISQMSFHIYFFFNAFSICTLNNITDKLLHPWSIYFFIFLYMFPYKYSFFVQISLMDDLPMFKINIDEWQNIEKLGPVDVIESFL